MHASKMLYGNLNMFVDGSNIKNFDISGLPQNFIYVHRNNKMYKYLIHKVIVKQFSRFHTTFWKQTLQTTEIGNFVKYFISNVLIV